MTTPDEIRALYIETLACADYMRLFEPDGFRWDSTTERVRDGHRRRAAQSVAALSEAGLLPTGVEGRYIGRGLQRRTRYVTDWVEAE